MRRIAMRSLFVLFIVSILVAAPLVSHARTILSEDDALRVIEKLPEVQAFIKEINNAGGGVKPIIRLEGGSAAGDKSFQFYVGESHSTHNVLWKRFAVDKKTSKISVFDIMSGEYVPIGDWRKSQGR